MSTSITVGGPAKNLFSSDKKVSKAAARAAKKAASTSVRDMTSEAVKRIKARKRLKTSVIKASIRVRKVKGSALDLGWGLDVSGKPVPLIAYPHRQTKQGVVVQAGTGFSPRRTR